MTVSETRTVEDVLHDSLQEWNSDEFCELGWNRKAAARAIKDLRDAGFQITAALSDQPNGWQDISTAPKDGTTISAWHKLWKCPVSIRYGASRTDDCKWLEATLTTAWPDIAFTHWQPLPSPPSPSGEGK